MHLQFPITASEIILKGNQLSRIKNDSFSTAPYLRQLDLSSNSIDSLEPAAFNQLGSLEVLDLSSNKLRGE
jgi:Leucine-rich repeat (LRR) protein